MLHEEYDFIFAIGKELAWQPFPENILSAPRMKMRIHQIPVGICRTIITSNKPAGNARSIATVIGEKFGRYWVVTM